MRRLSPIVAVAVALAFALPQASQAASLSLATTVDFRLSNLSVVVSAGDSPSSPAPYPGTPTLGAATAGIMNLNPVGAPSPLADMSFSFSMFSAESPLVLTGSYGPSEIPVTLAIHELSYSSPVGGGDETSVVLGVPSGSREPSWELSAAA